MHDLQRAILRADPKLSKFDPLERIMFFDDFNRSMSGWNTLLGNYTESLSRRHPGYVGFVPPMISNVTHWDGGTHGALDGSYALKLATRARRGAQTVALKRLTFPRPCLLQMECYFTFKPEATEAKLSELDVRSFGFAFDFQDAKRRVLPQFRYLNAFEGEPVHKWQYKEETIPFRDVGDKTVTVYHYGEENWKDVPAAARSSATTSCRRRSTGTTSASPSTSAPCATRGCSATTSSSTCPGSPASRSTPCRTSPTSST
jgi:hypothetical protein